MSRHKIDLHWSALDIAGSRPNLEPQYLIRFESQYSLIIMATAMALFLNFTFMAMILSAAGRSMDNRITKTKNDWPPDFCHSLDCPKFTVIDDTHSTWKERSYNTAQWVGTSGERNDKLFEKLFAYISGANEGGVTIPMAVPVLEKKTIDEKGPALLSNITMFFFLPYTYQNTTAPKPTDKDVFLSTTPALTAFVRSYSGYTSDTKELYNAGSLAADLTDQWPYDHSYFYYAGYDSPWTILGRHNEIWFVGTN